MVLKCAAVRGLLLDVTPARGREFRLLFLGQLVSFFGSMITIVALPFQMRACATRAAGPSCWAPTWSTSTRCSSACRRRSSPPSRPTTAGAEVLGVLLAAPAVGSILIAMFSGWTRHVHRHGRAVALAAAGWGVAIVAFGFAGVTAGAREDAGRAVVGYRTRGAKLRLRSPWKTPFGRPTGAPAPETRAPWLPAAEALRALALPVSWTLRVMVVALPTAGLNVTSSW
jgi:hypothetical protein